MYLRRIHLKNFRSFADFTVQCHPGLNLIVGENNIGKSNVVDGMRIALGSASLDRSSLRAQRSDLHRDASGKTATEFEITLEFGSLSKDDMATFLDLLVYDAADPIKSTAELCYRWSWHEGSQRYSEDRWGGGAAERAIKPEVLQSLPAAYLEPLRDAQAYLSAGRGSRISTLLSRLSSDDERERLVTLMKDTSRALRAEPLIVRAREAVLGQLHNSIGGTLSPDIGLAPVVPTFPAITQSIRATLRVPGTPEDPRDGEGLDAEIAENGMGYNNLLFIATVLAYRAVVEAGDVPLILIEEPEAHLHPQLQLLLADFLLAESRDAVRRGAEGLGSAGAGTPAVSANAVGDSKPTAPQVFLTSHSPNLASHVPPDRLIVFHRSGGAPPVVRAGAIRQCGLPDRDLRKLRRLLDATKASLFFARGLILVEGITEQLLLPVLAQRHGVDLNQLGVSVVALHGLGFPTVLGLFGGEGLSIPCAVVTDGDPPIPKVAEGDAPILPGLAGTYWKETPEIGKESPAVKQLRECVSAKPRMLLRVAKVTLEHELALQSEGNAELLATLFTSAAGVEPDIFTLENLKKLSSLPERARFCWQAICRKDGGRHKGALAQVLASELSDGAVAFEVPRYLADVFDFMRAELAPGSGEASVLPVR